MGPERLPLSKFLDTPFISLDETNVEMFSILFLFVAVILITQIKKRRQFARHLVQGVSLVVFFYLIYSCLGVFGMIRNGLYGATLLGTAYTESFYWMALPTVVIASTLIAGPIFCGWICPTGTIQEFCAGIRHRFVKPGSKPSRLQLILLGASLAGFFGAVVYLSYIKDLFVEDSSLHWGGSLLLICYLVVTGVLHDVPTRALRLISLVAIFVTALSHVPITSPVHFAFTARNDPASMTTTIVIAVASLFVLRSWCRYVCPFGYLLGFLHRFSRVRLAVKTSRCDGCLTCARSCDVGAIDKKGIRHRHCQFCYACVDACPKGAIEVIDVWQEQRDKAAQKVAPLGNLGDAHHSLREPGD